jgi:hypothetical protein
MTMWPLYALVLAMIVGAAYCMRQVDKDAGE